MPSNTFTSTPTSLTVNNETFTNSTAIANQLNHHFVNIGKLLVTNLSGSNDNDYLTCLKLPCTSSIYFYPTAPSEIMNMISKLKINKANGHDDIMPFFLRISANIIARPLSAILNQCIAFSYFPNKLKIAEVIPVYKTGPTRLPIWKLSTHFSSIFYVKNFERLNLNRLISFFQRNEILIPTQFGF